MLTLTRRALLASPLAAALPSAASPAISPELAAAASALSGILDRMAVLWEEDQRLHRLAYPAESRPGAREAFRRFNEEVWEPTCDAMDAAEERLRDAMESAGVKAMVVAGRLYVGIRGAVGMDRDHYPQALTVINMADVVGLDATKGGAS